MSDSEQDDQAVARADPLLARLKAVHPPPPRQLDRLELPPTIVRVWDDHGHLQFACITDNAGARVKIRLMASGQERWIERNEIVEAA